MAVSPAELAAYVADEDNGLFKACTVGDTKVQLVYRPTDLLVLQDVGSEVSNVIAFDATRKKYENFYYFILSLSTNDKEALHQTSRSQYTELVNTLAFRMGAYVNLTTMAGDTIPVADFILNRTYDLSNSTDLLFVFPKGNPDDNGWLQFNLKEFGLGIGDQRFRFENSDLLNTPRLTIFSSATQQGT